MEQRLKEEIEGILAGIRPSLGGADLKLMGIKDGVVTVRYSPSISWGSSCKVVFGSSQKKALKEIAVEVLEEQLKKVIPEVTEIIVV